MIKRLRGGFDVSLWLTNCRLIDGIANRPQVNMSLEICGSRVGRILESGALQEGSVLKQEDHVIDLKGKTVLPGLWDSHMHLTFFINPRQDFARVPDLAVRAAQRAKEFLEGGVTSCRVRCV